MKKIGAAATLVAAIAVIAGMSLSSANAQVTVVPVCPPGVTDANYCTYYYVSPTPTVTPPPQGKKRPKLSLKATPKRDPRRPFRFTARGRVILPDTVAKRRGCRGSVTVRFKQGRKTVKTKRVPVKRSNCRYVAKRLKVRRVAPPRRGIIKVRARFNGNAVLKKVNSRAVRIVRYGPKRR